ncbi:GntR family transcriptional regulator [uncultured Microbacterium sp.]|uniref:GntR family transcriptional regulator n=1 Tax=uncultured Microbacterium sp. TaxID=191216 RepID=UPI0028D23178|nr:GntR family transcriptional regulator [uncultured Microbacterium sp.]
MTIAPAGPRAHQRIHRGSLPLPELAFEHILAGILSGEYGPGERLNTGRFADELHMSLNPIREAIIRLRDIGLVEVTPARYTKVADFAGAKARAAIGYAGMLVGIALRAVLPSAAQSVLDRLVATVEEIDAAATTADRDRAVVAFLSAVSDLIDHPRQAMHLVETTILVQCALRSSEIVADGSSRTRPWGAREVALSMRAGDADATERAVRSLFGNLA